MNSTDVRKAQSVVREASINTAMSNAGFAVENNYLDELNNRVEKSVKLADKVKGDYIKKSGTIGYNANPESGLTPDANGVGTVAALRREALSNRLTNLTYGKDKFIFYYEIMENAEVATSTVVQYTVFDSHSPVGHGMTNYEGMVSDPTDPHMTRKVLPMKYLSKSTNMSMQSILSQAIEDPLRVYKTEAVTDMISQIEWESYYGDADLSANPETMQGTEFDGLVKLIPKDNVIDNRGKALDAEVLSDAVLKITTAQGNPTDMFMPAGAKAKFVNYLMKENQLGQIAIKDNEKSVYQYGFTISQYVSPVTGTGININGSSVMNIPEQLNPSVVGTAGTALTPVIANLDADSKSKTVKTGDNGQFRDNVEVNDLMNYKFVTVLSNGTETVAADAHASVTTADSSVTFDFSLPNVGTNTAVYVAVYRQAKDGLFWLLKRIGIREADKDGNFHFVDRNEKIAGTVDVFIGDMSPDVITMYQLLPIDFLPLAQFNASYTWTYLWFGALALKAPRRWVRITNVDSINAQFTH